MASTQVIIVYSPNQNLRRRVVIPDDDAQIPALLSTHLPGEAYLIVSKEDYETYGADALVGWHTMAVPGADDCMVIKGNLCWAYVKADPLIDTHPLGEIRAYARLGRTPGHAVGSGNVA